MDNYVVMAYRWGQRNAHSYIVASGTDLDAMISAAEEECGDRGGKYGVSVILIDSNRMNLNHKEVKYFPSLFGEKTLYYNHDLNAQQSIAMCVIEAVKAGHAYLTPNDGSTLMKIQEVEVPDWLRDEVNHRLKLAEEGEEE